MNFLTTIANGMPYQTAGMFASPELLSVSYANKKLACAHFIHASQFSANFLIKHKESRFFSSEESLIVPFFLTAKSSFGLSRSFFV